jgi:hypothetical protein
VDMMRIAKPIYFFSRRTKETGKQISNHPAIKYIFALIAGTTAFIYVTGGRIFNPTYTSWLMIGDSAQHYAGWRFFRNTPILQWPLGKNAGLGMEFSSSIVFTDSLPLGAIICKYMRFLLPTPFQYFGIWIWLCFVLQALFAWKVLKYYINQQIQIIIGSCFLVLAPALTYRLVHQGYGHMALASHFVILAAMNLYLSPGLRTPAWSVLLSATSLIHAYFMPLVMVFWIAAIFRKCKNQNLSSKAILKHLVLILGVLFLTMIAIGYTSLGMHLFLGDSSVTPDSWNYIFRWQPLSLIDGSTDFSTGWSHFLFDQKELFGDVEGFSFLGSGVIALLLIVGLWHSYHLRLQLKYSWSLTALTLLALIGENIFLGKKVFSMTIFSLLITFILGIVIEYIFGRKKSAEKKDQSHKILFIGVFVLALYSMTNRPGIGKRTFFEYPLVPIVKSFTQTFRTHGRSIWPAYYLVIIVVLVFVCRHVAARYATSLLFVGLVFQILDSNPAVTEARHRFTESKEWVNPMQDPYWKLLSSHYENLVIYPPTQNDPEKKWVIFTDFAADHNLATNSGYFSRWDTTQYEGTATILGYQLLLNELNPKTLYVVSDNDFWDGLVQVPQKLAFRGTIDGFHVVAPLYATVGK